MSKVQLGDEVRDTITGFAGVVIGEHKWLHGCKRYTVQPRELKDGKPVEAVSFDEPQLEVTKAKVATGTSDTGGPRDEVRRPSEPKR